QGSRRKSDSRAESTTGSDGAYTPDEMMASVAARELVDGEVVFVGIGLPNLACNLARVTHAPNLVLIYESGAVGAAPVRLPVSIGDPALVTGSLMVCGMADVFQLFLQNGRIEIGFLGGAQVDRYGNINTTVIGSYDRPTVRLPGSGGAAEIAVHAHRTLIVAKLNPRGFPEQVDFITSPGQRSRGAARRELGMPGRGPVKVIIRQGDPRGERDDGRDDAGGAVSRRVGRSRAGGRRMAPHAGAAARGRRAAERRRAAPAPGRARPEAPVSQGMILVAAAVLALGQGPGTDSLPTRVRQLADAYVAAYFERHPDEATLDGVAAGPHDRLPDDSPLALADWQAREDAWLAELRAIDPAPLGGRPEAVAYGVMRDALEGAT